MNRYETNSKGLAPAISDILNDYANAPRSSFDKTHQYSVDVAPFYIIPINCLRLLPNSDVNMSFDIQVINKNPTIRRMLGSMQLELRTYLIKESDCWEGYNNFVTCGRSGKIQKTIPRLKWRLASGKTTCLPYNPYFTMNIAPSRYIASSSEAAPSRKWSFEANQGLQSVSDCEDSGLTLIPANTNEDSVAAMHDISALPAVFYCKIAKEYQNSNLLQENPYWYPENENHSLILPYSLPNNADSVTNASYDACTDLFGSGSGDTEKNSLMPTNDSHSMPWLNVLYKRQRKGNYFNTGSPFPNLLRGDVPSIDLLGAKVDLSTLFQNLPQGLINRYNFNNVIPNPTSNQPPFNLANISHSVDESVNINQLSSDDVNSIKNKLNAIQVQGISFSMSQWRRLAVMTVFREKMARTDGSYNQMIQAQFGINPNWHEHEPTYVGGSIQPIVFSEVTQTSADDSTPLGTTAGKFFSADMTKNISFHTNDFSMAMTVLTIVPDDIYCQGVDRLFSAINNSDIPFPIMNNLDPQAILNKELLVTGNDSTDNDVLAYAERFSEWKSERNKIAGLLAMPISKVGDVGAFFFNRILTASPQFNWSFVEGNMTSNENLCFSSTEQAQFVCKIAKMIHVTYPLPRVSRPSDMGISYA